MNSIRRPRIAPAAGPAGEPLDKRPVEPGAEPITRRQSPGRALRRTAAAALAALLASSLAPPAHAGGGWGLGWSSPGYYHGYRGYHGGYHGHHGHARHGHGGSSGDGWIAAGILALVGAGIYLAATADQRRPEPYHSYPTPPVNPPAYPPPSSSYQTEYDPGQFPPGAVPQAYPVVPESVAHPRSVHAPGLQYSAGAPSPSGAAAAPAYAPPSLSCERQAVNHSGYDPATASAYTTEVSVNAYQQALQACRAGQAG